MNKKFKDICETKINLDEEMESLTEEQRKQFQARLEFAFGVRDKKNLNGRTYRGETWDPAVENFGEELKSAWKLGDLDHPDSGGTALASASHLLSKVWLDEDGKGMAEAFILNTSKGNDFLTILKSKVKIGASIRGVGEVDSNGFVKPGLKIRAIDFVESPSFGDHASIDQSNLMESYSPIIEEKIEDGGEMSLDEKRMAGAYNPKTRLTEDKVSEKTTKAGRKHFAEFLEAGGIAEHYEDWKKRFGGGE